ncbi:MAG: hypothetical protein HY721_03970 [Planctomycetes bacterium]|nr:hypothetical protein [Planctomycetota bacterium]
MTTALLSLALAGWLSAGPFEGYREEPFAAGKLLVRGWPEEARAWAAREIPRALARVEGRLGRTLGRQLTAVLVPDGFELRRIVERLSGKRLSPETTLGVALPEATLLLLRWERPLGAEPLDTVLAHEVAHLVVRRSPRAAVPRWLDEGLASWASGKHVSRQDDAQLSLLARVDGLYTLRTLEREFPEGETPGSVAYLQSHLFVVYLVERWGDGVVPRILDELESGAPSARALEAATAVEQTSLEREFGLWAAARCSLLGALARTLSLWTLVGLLALGAVGRYVAVRRRRLERLDPAGPALGPADPAGAVGPAAGAKGPPPPAGGQDHPN